MNPDPQVIAHNQSVRSRPAKLAMIRRVLTFALPHATLLILFLFAVTASAFVGITLPLIYRTIINKGILHRNATLVAQLGVGAICIGFLDALLGLAQTYLAATIGARVVLTLRTRLFEHIQDMPLAFFTHTQTGSVVSRVNDDVEGARTAFTGILSTAFGNLITVVLVLTAMFTLSWRLTLLGLVLPSLFVLPAHLLGRRLQTKFRERAALTASLNGFMVERFAAAGVLLTKLFGRRIDECKAFQARATHLAHIEVRIDTYGRLFVAALLLTSSVATSIAYGWGGMLAIDQHIDVGTVVALASYLGRIYFPFLGLANIQVTLMTALVSFERVFEILDLKSAIREKPDALVIPTGAAEISFDHVSFQYPNASETSLTSLEPDATQNKTQDKTRVLNDISFTVEPGKQLAIVGSSGAGKSTIAQLIVRLYDVESGAVTINGIDVRDARLDSLHRCVGIVTQDTHLFHQTLRANLLYAKPDATDGEIVEALRRVGLLSRVESFPHGIETVVGERGYHLSGGERQRLAIARLLLQAPDVVILDEATAHLDAESEASLQNALETALIGRTVIVIAHRFSTILDAHQILVMQNGRVVQRGKHAELLKAEGIYSDLYYRQVTDYPS
jgi:ATP-binding cassette, subfamily B, bacterial